MDPGPESRTALLEAELAATKASLASYHNTLQHLVSELANTKQPQQQQQQVADPYSAHSKQPSRPLLQRSASFQEGAPQGSGGAGGSGLPAFASMFQLSGAGSASSTSLAGLNSSSSGAGGTVEDMHCSAGMLAAMEALSVSHNASSNTPFGLSGSLSSGALPDVGQGGPDAGGAASRMPSMHALLQQGSTELPPALSPALPMGERSYAGLPSSGVDKPITSAPADVAAAAVAAAAAAGGSHGLLTGLSMINSNTSSYPPGGASSTYTSSTATGGERSDASWSGMRDDQGSGWGHHHHHPSGRPGSRGLMPVSAGDSAGHLPQQQATPLPPLHPHPMGGSGAMLPPLGLPLLHHNPHGGGVPGAGLGAGGSLGGPRLPPAEEAALLQQHYALLMEQGGGAAMAAAAAAAAAGLGGIPPHPGSELLMGMGGVGMHHPGLGPSLGPGPLGHPPGNEWEQALAFANAQAANSMYAQAQLAHAHAAAAVLEQQQQHALMIQQQLAAQAHYHPYAQHLLALAAKQHSHGGLGGYPRVGSQGRLRGGGGGGGSGRNSWPGDTHRGRDTARKPPHPLLDKAPRAPRSRNDPPDWRRVFVGNIGWWVDEAALEAYFSKYGKVTDTQVMWNTKLLAKGKKVNREFAFVSFTTPEEAEAAIRGLHRVYIEGLVKDKDGLTVQYEAQGFGHTPGLPTGPPGSSSSSGYNGAPAAAAGPGSTQPAGAVAAGYGENPSSSPYGGDTWGEGEQVQRGAADAGDAQPTGPASGTQQPPPPVYERLHGGPAAGAVVCGEGADASSGLDRPLR